MFVDVTAIDLFHESGSGIVGEAKCRDLIGTVPDLEPRMVTSGMACFGVPVSAPGLFCIRYWSVRVTEDVGRSTCD